MGKQMGRRLAKKKEGKKKSPAKSPARSATTGEGLEEGCTLASRPRRTSPRTNGRAENESRFQADGRGRRERGCHAEPKRNALLFLSYKTDRSMCDLETRMRFSALNHHVIMGQTLKVINKVPEGWNLTDHIFRLVADRRELGLCAAAAAAPLAATLSSISSISATCGAFLPPSAELEIRKKKNKQKKNCERVL